MADGQGGLSPPDGRLIEKSENTLSRFLEVKGAGVLKLKGWLGVPHRDRCLTLWFRSHVERIESQGCRPNPELFGKPGQNSGHAFRAGGFSDR